MATLGEKYLLFQEKSGIKVGDRVMVTSKAEHKELGWLGNWRTGLKVGQVGKVRYADGTYGFGITFDSICDTVWCPYFVLKVVKEEKRKKVKKEVEGKSGRAEIRNALRVGDKVRIVRRPTEEEETVSHRIWISPMDYTLGLTGFVVGVCGNSVGVCFLSSSGVAWNYPSCVLERVGE